jgi:outer membrane receptor protein involved in Fe transport
MNDEFEGGPFDGLANQASGAHNRTRTTQQGSGAALQWNLNTERQQLTVGSSLDNRRMRFVQTQEIGIIDASRGISELGPQNEENALRGTTRTASLFLTDTVALTPTLHLTGAARYNMSRVTTHDELNPNPPNLDGDHSYRKLNPALGLTWQAAPALNAYAASARATGCRRRSNWVAPTRPIPARCPMRWPPIPF